MPRVAIKDYNTSFFHVMVQGIRKEYIFEEIGDLETYSNLLSTYAKKFPVKIIAYCIMNNHAHLLVYVDKVNNLSLFMKCVNTTYALYYNKKYKKTGYVFRNRYKAEPIFDVSHLINCISYIHNNPVAANICNSPIEYKFSSYIEYKNKIGTIINYSKTLFPEINYLFIDNVLNSNTKYDFIDYQPSIDYVDKNLIIEDFLNKNNLNKDNIIKNKKIFKKLVLELKEKSGLLNKEISAEFKISPCTVSRILNDEKQKNN